MHLILIINSIVCVVGTVAGLFFAGGSIISIANMTVPWRTGLLVAALLVPVAFIVSGVGAWLANAWASTQIAIGLVALPWVYLAVFVAVMLMSFRS